MTTITITSRYSGTPRPHSGFLSFIRSKQNWGSAFRYGFIRIPEADFAQIATAMGCELARDFPP